MFGSMLGSMPGLLSKMPKIIPGLLSKMPKLMPGSMPDNEKPNKSDIVNPETEVETDLE